jgi:KDO2-lipid IV(A) lauroyltransferase
VEGRIVPLVVRMTPQGYDAKLMPAWENFPTDDMSADTAQMNSRLQSYIDTMPAQYYWVHKRFKDRPEGEPSVY